MLRSRPIVSQLVSVLLAAAGLFLTFFSFSSGCQGKVNQNQVSLLSTVRVSLGEAGAEGNAEVVLERPDISDDGRFVVFASKATNLVPGVTEVFPGADIYMRDNLRRRTFLVTRVGNNTAFGVSTQPSISGNGRLVAFTSTANDLSPEDLDATADIYVADMGFVVDEVPGTPAFQLVSRISGNAPNPANKANGASGNPRISKDGHFVVFDSAATNLDVDDNNTDRDVYRREIDGNGFVTMLVSRSSGVPFAPGPKGTTGISNAPSVSRDGHLVAFVSTCQDMVPTSPDGGPKGGTNPDIFVHNVDTRQTIRVSVAIGVSKDPNGPCSNPILSGDGTVCVYQSNAFNLNVDDDGSSSDIFLRDISDFGTFQSKPNEIISVHSSGAQAGAGCNNVAVTDDGMIIVWDSPSTNLVNGDSNNRNDVFMRDRNLLQTVRISVATYGGELNADSRFPAISKDGKYVIFHTQATNAADEDENGAGDFYMRGPPF
jgi:Tol biopolymer transport system component